MWHKSAQNNTNGVRAATGLTLNVGRLLTSFTCNNGRFGAHIENPTPSTAYQNADLIFHGCQKSSLLVWRFYDNPIALTVDIQSRIELCLHNTNISMILTFDRGVGSVEIAKIQSWPTLLHPFVRLWVTSSSALAGTTLTSPFCKQCRGWLYARTSVDQYMLFGGVLHEFILGVQMQKIWGSLVHLRAGIIMLSNIYMRYTTGLGQWTLWPCPSNSMSVALSCNVYTCHRRTHCQFITLLRLVGPCSSQRCLQQHNGWRTAICTSTSTLQHLLITKKIGYPWLCSGSPQQQIWFKDDKLMGVGGFGGGNLTSIFYPP